MESHHIFCYNLSLITSVECMVRITVKITICRYNDIQSDLYFYINTCTNRLSYYHMTSADVNSVLEMSVLDLPVYSAPDKKG